MLTAGSEIRKASGTKENYSILVWKLVFLARSLDGNRMRWIYGNSDIYMGRKSVWRYEYMDRDWVLLDFELGYDV